MQARPPALPPAATTTVTLSLPALITELKNHVPDDKKAALDRLVKQANDKPDEQAQIKQQMGQLASAAELRAAVTALLDQKPAAPPAAPTGDEELEALFGKMSKEDFRTSLIHAFHCHTPSCPVPGCAAMSSKLERLHQHVSSCSTSGCVLCRMWTYLKYYRESYSETSSLNGDGSQMTGGLCQALYVEPLLESTQLLPCWQNGKVSWVPPRDALKQLQELTSVPVPDGGMDATPRAPSGAAGGRVERLAESAGRASKRAKPSPPNGSTTRLRGSSYSVPSIRSQQSNLSVPPGLGLSSIFQSPAAWQYPHLPDGAGLHGLPTLEEFKDFPHWPEGETIEAQVPGAMRTMGADNSSDSHAKRAAAGLSSCAFTNAFTNPPISLSKQLSGIPLNDLLKFNSLSDLSFSHAGRTRSEVRERNISEVSLGALIEGTSGDLNDILAEF